MRATNFNQETKINNQFLNGNPTTLPIQNALYTDPWYGLNNDANYFTWQVLRTGSDPITKLAFKSDLRTYFGLSKAQVDEMETNWNVFYDNNAAIINQLPPVSTTYRNSQGIAYWQWATSFFTRDDSPSYDSVINTTNTITGYGEIYYFKKAYFLPNINAEN